MFVVCCVLLLCLFGTYVSKFALVVCGGGAGICDVNVRICVYVL